LKEPLANSLKVPKLASFTPAHADKRKTIARLQRKLARLGAEKTDLLSQIRQSEETIAGKESTAATAKVRGLPAGILAAMHAALTARVAPYQGALEQLKRRHATCEMEISHVLDTIAEIDRA
jgi:predicted  nucleic acid-binding Zn-ribbon protein